MTATAGTEAGPGTHEVVNPATEQVVQTVQLAGKDETDAAVARARKAFPSWRAVAPADRGRLLRRFAELVDRDLEHLAQLEVSNAGHPISSARNEAAMVRDVLHYYAGAPERHMGQQIPVAGGLNVTFQEPLGVVGVIVPWNFPMPIASWSFGPALAAGNTVVLKPAELTPLTAIRLGDLAREAGLPEGVLEVLPGKGSVAGWRLAEHPDVAKVSFTGSTPVGTAIAQECARQVKPVTLELGGKSANVVFADADIDTAAAAAPYGVFDNAGQDCCARSRILVQRSVFDSFMERLEPAVRNVRVDPPTSETAEMGPLITAAHRDRVSSYVPSDAPVVCQGSIPDGPGYWFPPTVLAPVSSTDPALTEEVFGPVVVVVPFDEEADAIRIANDSVYGLSGSIWTENIRRGLRVARGIEAGNLSVNSHASVRYSTPFGGFKQSGLGRELGPYALDAFTETKNVFVATEE